MLMCANLSNCGVCIPSKKGEVYGSQSVIQPQNDYILSIFLALR
jgi:hypothetical protein